MRTVRWLSWAAAVAAAVAGAGCGNSSSSSSSAAPPPATSTGAISMVIESITLPDPASLGTAGGQQRPVVRFHVTDNTTGQPINLANEVAAAQAKPPGIPNSAPRFTLAQRDDRNDYRSYYASTANPKPYTVPEGEVAPPTSPQLQASATPSALALSDLKEVGGGSYEYTMPATNQTGFDRSKTHTVAGIVYS